MRQTRKRVWVRLRFQSRIPTSLWVQFQTAVRTHKARVGTYLTNLAEAPSRRDTQDGHAAVQETLPAEPNTEVWVPEHGVY